MKQLKLKDPNTTRFQSSKHYPDVFWIVQDDVGWPTTLDIRKSDIPAIQAWLDKVKQEASK